MQTIQEIIASYQQRSIEEEYFRENLTKKQQAQFHIRAENSRTNPDFKPEKIIFKPEYTPYALVLSGPKKGKSMDVALLGFDVQSEVAECKEIHGGRGMYLPLTHLTWDKKLLSSLIDISKQAQLQAVTVMPAQSIPGMDRTNYLRLQKRYNLNAQVNGFKFSDEIKHYVLEL